ncbi:MAG TPA: HAMP domain-containing sensor histidine kinase [Pyrinomonadaceae bacterium]|jgi:signal transduction histidine kinase|nr:HAMP domain-containing sensor histidine kinase [Pyrinomonadaceae bacterium]
MSEMVKTSPGVVSGAAGAGQAAEHGQPRGGDRALSEEVLGLLHEQAFGEHSPQTEREVCEAFSNILLRHWDLCCVTTFLRDERGRLRPSTNFTHPHLKEEDASRISELLTSQVEATGGDFEVWAEDAGAEGTSAEIAGLFIPAGLKGAAAIPIRAHDRVAGALVVASSDPERVRKAVAGAHCVGPAILIAIGNARRGAAIAEQRRRIESLVEELRRGKGALEEANRELQRVGRYRSLFLQRMSHELRTPLTSILGFAEILLDQEDLTGSQRRFCEKIQSSGFTLQASLNQLVDLSRLEAGHTELFLHEFSLRETLRESCVAVARLAQKQDVKLDCETAPDLGAIVSDEGKLRQVLYNFLAFAIGRTPTGGHIGVRAAHADGGRISIEIADQGEPLTDPAHLFEPVDIDAPNEHGTNMNELGLVIAHRLLAILGGRVHLRDLSPTGLSVTLDLPVRPRDEKQ